MSNASGYDVAVIGGGLVGTALAYELTNAAACDHDRGSSGARPDRAPGHGANGLLLGPYSARLVADLVVGRTPPTDIAPFRPERFEDAPRGA